MITKTCRLSGTQFEITDQEVAFFKKMELPLPTVAPKYREVMRMAFRNERNLYKSTCDFSGKPMISMYRPDSPYKVYRYDDWMSDNWTAPSLDYDFNKPFFEQYGDLQKIVPRVNLMAPFNENCEYVNGAEKNKNCFLIFVTDRCEDSYYLDSSFTMRDSLDCSNSYDSELSYACCDIRGCYHMRYSYLCENSSECAFCFDLRGCKDCLFSHGLRNKQYYVYNKQVSKEEYERILAGINFQSYAAMQALKKRFFEGIMPKGYSKMIANEESDGNFLMNTKNCHHCYDCEDAEDCMYVRVGVNGIKDVHDSHCAVDGSQLIYNNVSTTMGYNCHTMTGCWSVKNSCYSEYLQNCDHCIGCISLRRKEYCILNKQYSEAEYNRIKAHIIAELGDSYGTFFPLSLAPFSYHDSAFRIYNSLTPEEVTKIGWRMGDEHIEKEVQTEPIANLPDVTSDFSLEDSKKLFASLNTGRPFRIIPQEKALLQKIGAPLPRKHYDERFHERIQFRS